MPAARISFPSQTLTLDTDNAMSDSYATPYNILDLRSKGTRLKVEIVELMSK